MGEETKNYMEHLSEDLGAHFVGGVPSAEPVEFRLTAGIFPISREAVVAVEESLKGGNLCINKTTGTNPKGESKDLSKNLYTYLLVLNMENNPPREVGSIACTGNLLGPGGIVGAGGVYVSRVKFEEHATGDVMNILKQLEAYTPVTKE